MGSVFFVGYPFFRGVRRKPQGKPHARHEVDSHRYFSSMCSTLGINKKHANPSPSGSFLGVTDKGPPPPPHCNWPWPASPMAASMASSAASMDTMNISGRSQEPRPDGTQLNIYAFWRVLFKENKQREATHKFGSC